MKVGIIPDVHGNFNFEEKLRNLSLKVDKIIFLGDYCDSHNENSNWITQKKCLDKILFLKKERPDFYTLLLGNHDQHYLSSLGASTRISGRQHFSAAEIQEYLLANYEHFQMIEVIDNWIFSHAGISQTWFDNPLGKAVFEKDRLEFCKLSDINDCFKAKQVSCFNFNGYDPYGDDDSEGCTWIRPPSLIRYGIKDYNQCVGHTALAEGFDMDYWNLDSRIVTGQDYWDKKQYYKHQYQDGVDNLKNKYVFLDSPEQEYYSIIDTKTNEVEIFKVGE